MLWFSIVAKNVVEPKSPRNIKESKKREKISTSTGSISCGAMPVDLDSDGAQSSPSPSPLNRVRLQSENAQGDRQKDRSSSSADDHSRQTSRKSLKKEQAASLSFSSADQAASTSHAKELPVPHLSVVKDRSATGDDASTSSASLPQPPSRPSHDVPPLPMDGGLKPSGPNAKPNSSRTGGKSLPTPSSGTKELPIPKSARAALDSARSEEGGCMHS